MFPASYYIGHHLVVRHDWIRSGGFALQCEKEEQYNESIFYSVRDLHDRERLFKPRVAIHTTGYRSEASILEDSWRDLVSDYSLRLMSDPADKLIAIAGLAEMYSQRHGAIFGRYCAGHWDNLVAENLDWRVEPQDLRNGPDFYRAPSWSWAAVDGSRYMPSSSKTSRAASGDYTSHIEVLDCSTIVISENMALGAVKDGALRIRGLLGELFWEPTDASVMVYHARVKIPGVGFPDTLEERPLGPAMVLFLPLYSEAIHRMTHLDGLLLQPDSEGNFRRIGFASCFDDVAGFLATCHSQELNIL